jgi:superfamily II DNA or RNA helicase
MIEKNVIKFEKKATITLKDEVMCSISGLAETHMNTLFDQFQLLAENYFFNPKFKLGVWNGKIPFIQKNGTTYINLLDQILPYIANWGYKVKLVDKRVSLDFSVDPVDEFYFSHIINPKSNEPFMLEQHQVDAANALFENQGGIALAATGFGKAQPLTSLVLTALGWKTMGDIEVGDYVITQSGKQVKVLDVFPQYGERDCYQVVFEDGAVVECDAEHLWSRLSTDQPYNSYRVVNTITLKEQVETYKKPIFIPGILGPVVFGEQSLPLDPYFMGVLLAYLDINDVGEYFIRFATKIDIQPLKDYLYNTFEINLVNIDQYCEFQCDEYSEKAGIFFDILRVYIGSEIQVPFEYKYSSIEQRFRFFHGYCSVKGIISMNGNATLTFLDNRELLIKDMQEMIYMLGGVYTFNCKSNKMRVTLQYTGLLFGPNTNQRKRYDQFGKKNDPWTIKRRVKSVDYIGKKETKCILIDDLSHLYITDGCVITHNTMLNAVVCDRYHTTHNLKTITIVPSETLVNQTVKWFELMELPVGQFDGKHKNINEPHTISTWQTLKNYPEIMNIFQLAIIDECHGAQARVLNQMLNEYGKKINIRMGFTGTLPEHPTTNLTVRMALGKIVYEKPAHELIASGWLATPSISVMQTDDLEYYNKAAAEFEEIEYGEQQKMLLMNKDRLQWISDLLIQKNETEHKGNILCLVNSVPFGKKLHKIIPNSIFLYGKDDQEVRQQAYDLFETNDNLIVICTQQIAGVGLSIDRIFNLVFIDLGKSYIKVIQVIGRGLRKSKDKDTVNIIDICSNLPYANTHSKKRMKFYKAAKYKYSKFLVNYKQETL